MDYTPAQSLEPIVVERTNCRLAVLRSHPAFPNTLSTELEGKWINTNPAWPHLSVEKLLAGFIPPCHTDWLTFNPALEEEHEGRHASVIYVQPGYRPVRQEVKSRYEAIRL